MSYPNAPVAVQVLQLYQLLRRESLISPPLKAVALPDFFRSRTHIVSLHWKLKSPLSPACKTQII